MRWFCGVMLLALAVGSCAKPRPAAIPARPVPPPPVPPPVLSPQIGRQPDERLKQEAEARIDGAEQVARRIDQRRLAKDARETFGTIQDFLVKAREAVATKDYSRAFNLADKAKLLAEDLLRATH